MDIRYKKLGKNTAWLTIGSFGQKIMSFLFVPFYTFVLSTEEYGTVEIICTTVNLLWPFFTLLIDEALTRFLLDKNSDKSAVITIGTVVNLIGLGLLFLISPVALKISIFKEYYFFFILYYFAYSLYTYASYIAKGLEKLKVYSVGGIICTSITVLCNVVFLPVFKMGIKGYLLSYILGMLSAGCYLIFKSKFYKDICIERLKNKKLLKEMLRYALPMMPNSISWWISNSVDKFFVVHLCGAAVNGVYSVAYKMPSLVNVLSNIFINAWQISAVEEFDNRKSVTFYSKVYNMYNFICCIIVSGMIWWSRVIAKVIFLEGFFQAYKYVSVLLVGALFQTLSTFLGTIYTASKKTTMLFYSTLMAAVLNIVFNALCIPKYGAMGAAVATCLSYIVCWMVRLWDTRKIMPLYIHYFRDIMVYLILVLQCWVDWSSKNNRFMMEGMLFILVCIIYIGELKQIIRGVIQIIKKSSRNGG